MTFQELATRVSHRNTGKACNETIADQLLQRVSADENLHMIFYRDVTEAGLDIAPNQAMNSLHRVLRNFKMPGYTVPEFRRKAVIIAVGGVYDPRIHLDDVVMPVLKKWRIFEREDFTGEAAAMRDDLGAARRGARGDLREVRGSQAAPPRARAQGGREASAKKVLVASSSVLTEPAAHRAADRADRAGQPCRAGTDGRCDERRIPHAVPRTRARPGRHGQRAVRVRDGDRARARRAPSGHHAHDDVRARTSHRGRCSSTRSTRTPPMPRRR